MRAFWHNSIQSNGSQLELFPSTSCSVDYSDWGGRKRTQKPLSLDHFMVIRSVTYSKCRKLESAQSPSILHSLVTACFKFRISFFSRVLRFCSIFVRCFSCVWLDASWIVVFAIYSPHVLVTWQHTYVWIMWFTNTSLNEIRLLFWLDSGNGHAR